MTIDQYIQNINIQYKTGIAREHSYRGDLQTLIKTLCPDVIVTNEPARVKCGAPDYVLTKKDIPIGYIEAKDIADTDLIGKKANKEQFNRYKASLDNLIFTDYLRFLFFKNGELVKTIEIATIENRQIVAVKSEHETFTSLIQDFVTHIGQSIKSSAKLSKMMAGKAKMLAQVIQKALESDEATQQNSTLNEQMTAFKQILINDITPKQFADIYAQTIAYGMFAARLHDDTLDDFSRQEAASLIPKSNPFLRKLFQYISGYDIDTRIEWIVNDLADIFHATDVRAILNNFGKATQMTDPIIHFYENFLAEYDPKLRKARGVWYTPAPVVNFIVRAVDDILKMEFGLPDGIADKSKTKIKVKAVTKATADRRSKTKEVEIEKEVHKVQILDPATGTGTFLAEIVKHIYESRFKSMQGIWSSYVENDLIPRLNGFELLMASYAMAHLKLDLLLTETGYKKEKDQRFRVYLTNSLEESHPATGTLFASWLSQEASEANNIKRDTPVMCVIGNPPYSVSSTNKSEWIEELMKDYKKDLNERNIQPLSDDYIKFIRFGQYFIEKNGEGILAYISNNSFIDGIIHRQMRKNLLETFDKIYILDLHGSTKRRETALDGTKDQNVFDIQSGVSINIFIKTKSKKRKAKLLKFDLYGKRELKYEFLQKNTLASIDWKLIDKLDAKNSFKPFTKSDLNDKNSFQPNEIFNINASGITTERDVLTVQFDEKEFEFIVNDFNELPESEFRVKYEIGKDGRDWKYITAKRDLEKKDYRKLVILYRPFDYRHTLFTGRSKGFHSYPRGKVMRNFTNKVNNALIIGRQGQAMGNQEWNIVYTSNKIVDCNIYYRGRGTVFPLYIYEIGDTLFDEAQRTPNLNPDIIKEIASKLNLTFTPEKESDKTTFAPIDILDYIYAVLHSPTYREKYKEFLKIDFPRVPYPKDSRTFWALVDLGGQIRQIHLLESPTVEQSAVTYPKPGDNVVTRKMTKNSIGFDLTNEADQTGKVWINDEQYFEGVPLSAYNFYIGGYQPAQKWLKDRHGRELSYDDITHYRKIIKALSETERLMNEIDKIGIE